MTWREGTNAPLSGRFAAVRVRPAHRDVKRSTPRPEEWFMVEWPEGDPEPAKYWLATLPADTAIAELVANAKRRWRIERDYQELKGEIGLGHYEGRGWRGFHHHATLCIAAYGFLIAERSAFPPQQPEAQHPSKAQQYPQTSAHEAPPIRPERHVENSIATIRIIIARLLARKLDRCLCCQRFSQYAHFMTQ